LPLFQQNLGITVFVQRNFTYQVWKFFVIQGLACKVIKWYKTKYKQKYQPIYTCQKEKFFSSIWKYVTQGGKELLSGKYLP